MSSFTRLSDDAELTPLIVYGPYVNNREASTVVHRLAESSDVRVTYRPVKNRAGEFMTLWDSYDAAYDASTWFGANSKYLFNGPPLAPGYVIVDGMVVWSDGGVDTSYAFEFVVAAGDLSIVQEEAKKWTLRLPFHEVTA